MALPLSGFGPRSETDALQWTEGGAGPAPTLVPAYAGGTAPWSDVTTDLAATGKTWFLFVSDVIQESAQHWSGSRVPGDLIEAFRYDIRLAFRFTVRPSRFRFVPGP